MEIPIRRWDEMPEAARTRILARSEQNIDDLLALAQEIIDTVSVRGDAALRDYSARFDNLEGEHPLEVSSEEFDRAERDLDASIRAAIDYSIENVTAVHVHQRRPELELSEVRPGIVAGERTLPIESAGLYVPRGRGSFPSMLYMLAVPARIAGVPRVVVATPPATDGTVDPACLYAARRCGVSAVYRVGGVQAIAALAVGTESVPSVRKIVGPGSAYVAAAKRILRDRVDVGLPAGPSESVILADETADSRRVSRDLLIEAEHGSDSQALLVTADGRLAHDVAEEIARLVERTPEPRKRFLVDVFSGYGGVILATDDEDAAAIVNLLAPEHLQIRTAEPWDTMRLITSAGEILLGEHSAFSLANYAAGANAVLPTGGFARTWSGVSVYDFVKRTSVVQVSRSAYAGIAAHAEALAAYEGFYWQAEALRDRQ